VYPQEENPETQQQTMIATKAHPPQKRFKYDFVDKDLIAYMKDILLTFTTEDAQFNIESKLFLVQRIQAKLKDHGITVEDQDFIGLILDLVRIVNEIVGEENKESTEERERDMFLYVIASTFYKVGIDAFTMEEN